MRKSLFEHGLAHCRPAWLAAAAAVVGASGAASGQALLSTPIQNPTNGHWYAVLDSSGWTAAKDAAEAHGGYLVTIADAAENTFVQNDVGIATLIDGRLWIGFTDAGRAVNDFAWVTGEPVTYTNWNAGEPNNAGAGEDATEMLLSNGTWNDNSDNPPFICNGVVEWNEPVGGCNVGGTCSLMTQADCAAALGVYQGDFVLCTGACCLPDNTCQQMSEPACSSQSGFYQGDGTDCGSVVCPDLTGACCFVDFCVLDVQALCELSGGVFRGVGTTCEEDCAVPANDLCGSAQVISSFPAIVSGTTELATLDFEAQCGTNSASSAPGVWYRVAGTGHIFTATLCPGSDPAASTNYDAQISVYTDCGFACVDGSDDDNANGCGGAGGTVTFCTSVGTDYYIIVHGWSNQTGDFTMVVKENDAVDCSIPANDDCANAQALSLPALVSGATVAATLDTAPACPFLPSSAGVWYSVMGTGTEITATLCPDIDPNGLAGADFDTRLSVYTDCGALACVNGNDNTCGSGASVAFDTMVGQQYLVLVHGLNTGTFDLAVFETPSGACCFNDGSCAADISPAECAAMGGAFAGDGVSCGAAACVNLHADDVPIALEYNFNGIVHAPMVPTEQLQADNPNGFRAISDRAFRIVGGVAPDLAAAGATRSYNIITTGFTLDMVHVGNRNQVDNGNWAFDALPDGDTVGIQPSWLTNVDQSTVSNPINPGILLDATSSIGVIYHASNNGTIFDMTLEFSDATSATVSLDAPDWYADNNGVPFPPDFGVASQTLLAGPLSNGDGFEGAGDVDNGSDSAPLNLIEAVVTADSLLNGLGIDINGKTLTGITFGNRSNLTAGIGIYAATAITSAGTTQIDLALNFNGIAHSAASGGEQNMPNNPDGYRSISDRGLLFLDNHAPELPVAEMGYQMVETEFVLDIVFLGSRVFDTVVDTDNQGITPNWMGANPVNSATTNLAPGLGMTDSTRIGLIYHGSNGGASFDLTLGFSDSSTVTVRPSCPDWFANGNGVAAAPGAGLVVQRVLPGPLSGGDGFPGAGNADIGGASSPLNIVEAVMTRDQILADLGTDIAGKTLTSITFHNKTGGSLAVFAMSADGLGDAVCACEFDGNTAQVDVFDLLAYLDLWFANAGGADIDGNPGVDVFDLLAFLDCWFPASAGAPCP